MQQSPTRNPSSKTRTKRPRTSFLLPVRKSLVVLSVLVLLGSGYFNTDLWIYVHQHGEQLVHNNVQETKNKERVTVQHLTNGSSSSNVTNRSSTNESTTLVPWLNRTLTMLVSMHGGAMSNKLLFLAQVRKIQRTIEAALPGLSIRLILENNIKGTVFHECFPALRTIDSSGGRHDPKHFRPVVEAQSKWLEGRKDRVNLHNVMNPSQIELLRDLLKEQYEAEQELQRGIPSNSTYIPLPSSFPDNPYSIPLLSMVMFTRLNAIMQDADLYYDLRDLLRIDPSCCAQQPYDDETVFHFRNFRKELGVRKNKPLEPKFWEIPPGDAAHHLFGPPPTVSPSMSNIGDSKNNNSHSASNRMAIISRYADTAIPYAQALKEQGWEVRLIHNQSGIQDFCFAMSTKTTFVGVAHSTYAQMAGLLGNASTVRWYYLNHTMGRQGQSSTSFHYNHNNGRLGLLDQKRTFFPLDPSVPDSPRREFRQELFRPSEFITG